MLIFVLNMQKITMFLPAAQYLNFYHWSFLAKQQPNNINKKFRFIYYMYPILSNFSNSDQPNMICYIKIL